LQLDEIKNSRNRVVGTKQTARAIQTGQASKVFVARDAERKVVEPILERCREAGIEVCFVDSMMELGRTCGIKVGAAVAALLKQA